MILDATPTERTYQCPNCGFHICKVFAEVDEFTCPDCQTHYGVRTDIDTGRAAFFAPPAKQITQPLGMPRGSVRALVALAMSATVCIMLAVGVAPPSALLTLVLTVIGFYFGFRSRTDSSHDRIYDASVVLERPLSLPKGAIRNLLVVGFAFSLAIMSGLRPAFTSNLPQEVIEFFVILSGLIVGHFLGRAMRKARGTTSYAFWSHAKAAAVLLATLAIVVLSASGAWREQRTLFRVLSAGISFYFGTRS